MKNVFRAVLACSVLALTAAAHADTYTDSRVSGSITGPGGSTTNAFTSGSAQVGSAVEFSTAGSAAKLPYIYQADFTSTGLTFSVVCTNQLKCGGAQPVGMNPTFTATFTDTAFLDGSFIEDLSKASGIDGFHAALDGDVLTITGDLANTGSHTLDFTPAPTPEPSSIALLGTGLLGMAGVIRRRFKA